MLIDVKLARLHNPILVGGANLGTTLDPSKKTGLKIQVNPETNILYVTYNGIVSVEVSNLSGFIPVNPEDIGITSTPHIPPIATVITSGAPMKAKISHTAQVETPHGLNRSKL
jgi:hypothetical protein